MINVTLIEGDGIGKEITRSLIEVFDALDTNICFDIFPAGIDEYEKTGEVISNEVYESLEKNKLAIKGPITTPIGEGFRSVNVHLRKKYDLFANIRPVVSIEGVKTLFKNINLCIFRENTEDLYAGIEEMIDKDSAKSIKIITRKNSERIIESAFRYAKNLGIKEVTVVTKANIMKMTDGLFLETARNIAKRYNGFKLNEVLIDNMCMQLVMNPQKYGVIVTENLYGDILSDLCAGLVGGLGLVPGANIGANMAIFEPAHGSAPDIAEKNLANPTAMLLSACLLLDYIGDMENSAKIRFAISEVLKDKNNHTRDLGGDKTTKEFTKLIIDEIKKLEK